MIGTVFPGKSDAIGIRNSGPGCGSLVSMNRVIVGIIAAGRFLMRPIFRFIAAANLREIFTAAALLLVIGVAHPDAGSGGHDDAHAGLVHLL